MLAVSALSELVVEVKVDVEQDPEVEVLEAEVLLWVPDVVDLVVVLLDDFRPYLLVDWFPKFTRSYGLEKIGFGKKFSWKKKFSCFENFCWKNS
jgi:hypothetical protein